MKLRPYQEECVQSVLTYFKSHSKPALVVLPTGAGKSIVIAKLSQIAKGKVLVLAHVKELVEQNHDKMIKLGEKATIFSAGLKEKNLEGQSVFSSIQSFNNIKDEDLPIFSLVIIDECHRVSLDEESIYQKTLKRLQIKNPNLKVLGLTATPYRLGTGWIYNYHAEGSKKTDEDRFFYKCLYELPLSYMIKKKYLTPPNVLDAPVVCYDFSSLEQKDYSTSFELNKVDELIVEQNRITPKIVEHIKSLADNRKAVMVFCSTVRHAKEVNLLLGDDSKIVTGETSSEKRDEIIREFKKSNIKFLVNVSVLTTGFDAPNVDMIALLRPTESISLYQQIVGRGLRLDEDKTDCLIVDYTGRGHNIYSPEVGDTNKTSDSEPVRVNCPVCGFENIFWGKTDEEGKILEHYGRMCRGAHEDLATGEFEDCGFRFRSKQCHNCGELNDIAARICHGCDETIIDPDKKLKEAMLLKDNHVLACEEMILEKISNGLEIKYYDVDGQFLSEKYIVKDKKSLTMLAYKFVKPHLRNSSDGFYVSDIDQVINNRKLLIRPKYVIAKKEKYYWSIRDKIFDYEFN